MTSGKKLSNLGIVMFVLAAVFSPACKSVQQKSPEIPNQVLFEKQVDFLSSTLFSELIFSGALVRDIIEFFNDSICDYDNRDITNILVFSSSPLVFETPKKQFTITLPDNARITYASNPRVPHPTFGMIYRAQPFLHILFEMCNENNLVFVFKANTITFASRDSVESARDFLRPVPTTFWKARGIPADLLDNVPVRLCPDG